MLWEFPKPAIRPVLKPATVLWELHFVLSQFRTDRIMRLHPVPKQAQTAETTSSMLYVMFVLVECEHNLAWDAKSVCNLFRSQHSIITTWNCDQVPNSGQIAQKYLGKLLYLFSILEIPKGKNDEMLKPVEVNQIPSAQHVNCWRERRSSFHLGSLVWKIHLWHHK